jgi:replicative DNA helicase
MTTTTKKEAPHSQESEMIVLGSMLTNINSLNIGADGLDEDDFYFTEHKIIFQALKDAYHNDKPADVHLIGEELKRQDKLKSIGGLGYLTNLAQYAGTSSYIEEYIELIIDKSILRKTINFAQELEYKALNSPDDVHLLLDEAKQSISVVQQSSTFSQFSIVDVEDMVENLENRLKKFRGQKYLGLCQKTLPAIDDNLLGLRKLILLASAPNVGKTAFTIQLAIDVLKNHKEACLIFFSLEMPPFDILTRMYCNLSQMDYKTLVFGNGGNDRNNDPSAHHTKEDLESIKEAKLKILEIGNRLQIVNSSNIFSFDSRKVISFINEVKEKTKTERAIVIIDYLQVWPLPVNRKFASELEIDKWRIEETKKIRDGINDDPVIVISEARKPSNGEISGWGGDMSDVMGSARTTYTPDCVLLLMQMSTEDTAKLIHKDEKLKDKEKIEKVKDFLMEKGIAVCKLTCPKGRDGMQRFSVYLKFLYKKNTFTQTSDEAIRIEFETHSKEKK